MATMGDAGKRAVGQVWADGAGELCLILDCAPDWNNEFEHLGITFSEYVRLEEEETIRERYRAHPRVHNIDSVFALSKDCVPHGTPRHADLRMIFQSSNNTFMRHLFDVLEDAVLDLLIARESFEARESLRSQARFHDVIEKTHFDYDVAISFAGEQRELARELADALTRAGHTVFFDEFVTSTMWGSDLASFLDIVYRKKSKYCISLISREYAEKVWTKHELRSALSRRLFDNPDYLLPLRVDDTEIDGIQPTTGYLRFDDRGSISKIVEVFTKKLVKEPLQKAPLMTAKWIENINKINRLWNIDCTAFVIDRRYLRHEDGDQLRLGVNFGINVTVPQGGFLAPPEIAGANVLGLHLVAVDKKGSLRIADRWITAYEADIVVSVGDAIQQASKCLSGIDDPSYERLTSVAGSLNGVQRAEKFELDEFEVTSE